MQLNVECIEPTTKQDDTIFDNKIKYTPNNVYSDQTKRIKRTCEHTNTHTHAHQIQQTNELYISVPYFHFHYEYIVNRVYRVVYTLSFTNSYGQCYIMHVFVQRDCEVEQSTIWYILWCHVLFVWVARRRWCCLYNIISNIDRILPNYYIVGVLLHSNVQP